MRNEQLHKIQLAISKFVQKPKLTHVLPQLELNV